MHRPGHSRVVNGVKHIWYAEDLWRLAEGLPIEERDPSAIIDLDHDSWFGGKSPNVGIVLGHMRADPRCRSRVSGDLGS